MSGGWDVHGITDTQRSRYIKVWRAWRKQVKRYERVARAVAHAFGVPCPRITMPGTWQVDYSNAELDRVIPCLDAGDGKASQGLRQSAAQVFGARELIVHEAHAAVDEALSMGDDELARAECVRIYTQLRQHVNGLGEINTLTCADMMSVPIKQARELDSPFDWYKGRTYPWSTTAWELTDEGMVLWSHGLPVDRRLPNMECHDRFALAHGWDVDGLRYRGHGEGYKDQQRERAVEEALELVVNGCVPEPVKKRGRPKVTWLVLSALGRRGVKSCMYWSDRHAPDEGIELLLDTRYAGAIAHVMDEV